MKTNPLKRTQTPAANIQIDATDAPCLVKDYCQLPVVAGRTKYQGEQAEMNRKVTWASSSFARKHRTGISACRALLSSASVITSCAGILRPSSTPYSALAFRTELTTSCSACISSSSTQQLLGMDQQHLQSPAARRSCAPAQHHILLWHSSLR